jgi:hypothetical protein
VYISVSVAVMLIIRHWPQLQDIGKSMVTYGAISLLLLAPVPGRDGAIDLRRDVANLLDAWSVGTNADGMTSLVNSGLLNGPSGVGNRLTFVTERLRSRPIDNWTRRSRGIGGLTRYVNVCTTSADHLFTWFAPQVYFQSERPFGGGQVFLTQGWHATPADQRASVALLQRQRVPIVLENMDWEYENHFPIVAKYVRGHYRKVEISADWAEGYRVLIDPDPKPTGTYDLFDLPCYR